MLLLLLQAPIGAAAAPRASALVTWSASASVATADGVWSVAPPPTPRTRHSVVLDTARDRLVVFGGWDGAYRNDVWVLDLGGSREWSALRPAGTPPPPRSSHAAVFDPAGDRMIVFGGTDGAGALGDAWALFLGDSPAWTALTPSGAAPTPRFGHSAIFDAPRNRMVVFGGDDGGLSLLDECWSLALGGPAAWTPLSTSGPAPTGRGGHSAICDAPRGRMIVFGGQDGVAVLGDAGALDLASGHWSAFSPAGSAPAARSAHVAVFDPAANRMIVHGGFDGAFPRADAWSVNLAGSPAWTALAPSGGTPPARSGHAGVLDPVGHALVVFGGDDGALHGEALALSLGAAPAWSELAAPATPSGRYRHAAVLDPRGNVVVFGGYDGTQPYPATLWSLAAAGTPWEALPATGPAPTGRYGHTLVWDPRARRAVLFGGHDGLARVADPWSLALEPAPAWTALAPAGAAPSARQNHSAVRDARRDRMLVFGGFDGVRRNDVWSLPLASAQDWSALTPAGSPPTARSNHTAIYDPVRDRMIVFGGSDGAFRNDTWELSLSGAPEWRLLSTTGTPPSPRVGHVAVYDPIRDRMVVFGGDDLAFRDDAWALSLSGTPGWTPLAATGGAPPGRRFHAALYDPRRDALWMHGGWNGDYRREAAALVWGSPSRPVASGPAGLSGSAGTSVEFAFTIHHGLDSPRAVEWSLECERGWPGFPLRGLSVAGVAGETVHVAIAIPDSAAAGGQPLRLSVAFSGAESFDSVTTHVLTVAPNSTAVGPGPTSPFAITALGPNPARRAVSLALRAPHGGDVVLEWFDLGGRRLGGSRTAAVSAGTCVLALEAPPGASPGLHILRVRLGEHVEQAKVVLVR